MEKMILAERKQNLSREEAHLGSRKRDGGPLDMPMDTNCRGKASQTEDRIL